MAILQFKFIKIFKKLKNQTLNYSLTENTSCLLIHRKETIILRKVVVF